MSRRAVIVGIDDYKEERIPPLEGAIRDAEEIKEVLTEYGDFEVDNAHFLRGADATCTNIRRAVSDLLWETTQNEVALLYFSGHGFRDSYRWGYLAPYDMEPHRPLVNGLRMDNLRRLALSAQNKSNVLVILDCCYSGIAAAGERRGPEPDLVEADADAFAELQPDSGGVIILSSSASNQTSRERLFRHERGTEPEHAHGAFTFQLLEALSGGADYGRDKWISLASAWQFVSHKFEKNPSQRVRYFGADVTNAHQLLLTRALGESDFRKRLDDIALALKATELFRVLDGIRKLCHARQESPFHSGLKDLEQLAQEQLARCKKAYFLWANQHSAVFFSRRTQAMKALAMVVPKIKSTDDVARIEEDTYNILYHVLLCVDDFADEDHLLGIMAGYGHKELETGSKSTKSDRPDSESPDGEVEGPDD